MGDAAWAVFLSIFGPDVYLWHIPFNGRKVFSRYILKSSQSRSVNFFQNLTREQQTTYWISLLTQRKSFICFRFHILLFRPSANVYIFCALFTHYTGSICSKWLIVLIELFIHAVCIGEKGQIWKISRKNLLSTNGSLQHSLFSRFSYFFL